MTSLADKATFAFANASVWLSHPVLAAYTAWRLRRIPDFARPRHHGDLIQWRKHFDHNPLFGIFCDKLAARDWALKRVPELKLAEVMWVGTDPAALPEQFVASGYVVKSTSGSGHNYFPGHTKWTRKQRLRRLGRWLRPEDRHGEWGYSQVTPRLYVERLIGSPGGIVDLTFRCHDGVVSVAFAGTNWKTSRAAAAYLTADGERIDRAVEDAEQLTGEVLRPGVFARAAGYARRISAGLDQLRVDFIIDGEDIYLGELTVYSASGYGDEERVGVGPIIERVWLGAIGKSWFLATPQRGFRARYAEAFRRWVPQYLSRLAP